MTSTIWLLYVWSLLTDYNHFAIFMVIAVSVAISLSMIRRMKIRDKPDAPADKS